MLWQQDQAIPRIPINGTVTCVSKEMVTAETAYQSPARFR